MRKKKSTKGAAAAAVMSREVAGEGVQSLFEGDRSFARYVISMLTSWLWSQLENVVPCLGIDIKSRTAVEKTKFSQDNMHIHHRPFLERTP